MKSQAILGVIAGLIAISAYIPYVKSIVRKEIEPRGTSWLIWALIQLFVAISLIKAGEKNTIWFPIAMMSGNIVITIICRRQFGKLSLLEKWCVGLAVFSIPWMMVGLPTLALAINIFAKLLGSLPTYQKLLVAKGKEDMVAWSMYSLACVFLILSVESWTVGGLLYPICQTLLNMSITSLIAKNQWRKKGANQ